MGKVNYKDDFKVTLLLTDGRGQEIGWPEWDWEARLWTTQKVNAYRASSVGGVLTNCYRSDEGRIVVTLDGHGLSPGELHVDFTAWIPDDSYPDGKETKVTVADPGITLVRDNTDSPTSLEVEVAVSFAQLNAYDQAVAAGFGGTMEDYYAGLNMLPALSALTTDFASGKAAIAAALTAQGLPTEADAPMADMAASVASLYAAPTVDAGSVDSCLHATDADTTARFDIRNIVGRARRAEFPCTCGATFNLSDPSERQVTLPACDAVLLSDGTALSSVADGTVVTLAGSASAGWAVFYFAEDFFAWPWMEGVVHHDLCALDCHPCFSTSSTKTFVRLLTDADPADYDGHDFAFASGAGDVEDCAVEALPSGSSLITGTCVRSIRMASLKSTERYIADTCTSLSNVELPALQTASRCILIGCGRITHMALPSLEYASGSNLIGTGSPMEYFSAPVLKEARFTSASLAAPASSGTCVFDLPALETLAHVIYGSGVYIFNVPSLISHSCSGVTNSISKVTMNLGSQQGANLTFNYVNFVEINIQPGFTGDLTFPKATAITADNLRALLENLGDNTDGTTYRIQMGETNLAKLTDEEIAVATAKNYTIS